VTRWSELTGGTGGRDYAARFAALAASGQDVHGEASFCHALLGSPPATVLDAGCGTGRVAIRLAELGYRCTGIDADDSMLQVAREQAAHLPWLLADLSAEAGVGEQLTGFDLVVAAGNVIPLLAAGTLELAVANLVSTLQPGAARVCGFGLDRAHLPRGCPVTPLADFDAACAAAGLDLDVRFGTWDSAPFDPAAGYAVSVHRLGP
jgi:SAM-dependent methyltransferase